ncbi:MAG TPA: tetratricopeptide repeat protein [Gemmatimonadales bacterium]|nr:tetratricopeptide repeat protein [Gemmatimonadales bacterium]
MKDLQAAALHDSNDATVHYRLAMAYWDKEQWDDADRSLREALKLAPNYAEAHLAIGVLPARRGDDYWKKRLKEQGRDTVEAVMLESLAHIRRAFEIDPLVKLGVLGRLDRWNGSYVVAARGRTMIIPLREPWWYGDLRKGVDDLRGEQYESAFTRLQAVAADPRFRGDDRNLPGLVLWFHGLAAAHVMKFDAAARDFALLTGRAYAAEQDSTRSGGANWLPLQTNEYRYLMASMLYLAHRYDEAIHVFRRALEFDLGLYEAHVQMARMYEDQGQLDSALTERRLALDADQDDPDLLIDLAETLSRANKVNEAEAAVVQAERSNPRDARGPYFEGILADATGDSARAREAYTRFLEIAPSRFAGQIADARARLATLSGSAPP